MGWNFGVWGRGKWILLVGRMLWIVLARGQNVIDYIIQKLATATVLFPHALLEPCHQHPGVESISTPLETGCACGDSSDRRDRGTLCVSLVTPDRRVASSWLSLSLSLWSLCPWSPVPTLWGCSGHKLACQTEEWMSEPPEGDGVSLQLAHLTDLCSNWRSLSKINLAVLF